MKNYSLLATLLIVVWIAGCAGKNVPPVPSADSGRTETEQNPFDNATAAPDNATAVRSAAWPANVAWDQMPPPPAAAPAPPAASPPERQASPGDSPVPKVVRSETKTGEKISLNFDDAEIFEVINALSDFLGINYIIDPTVKGKVNIHTSTEIDKGRLLPILETIFDMNNIAMVQLGDFYKIMPVKEASKEILDISIGKQPPEFGSYDRVLLQIVPLEYVPSSEMEKIVKPFVSKGGELVNYPKGNLLIIFETAATVSKVLKIINVIDAAMFEQMHVRFFKVKNADVNDIAGELEDIFASYGVDKNTDKGIGIKFLPIDRISSILAVSSIPGIFEQVNHWLGILDTVDIEAGERLFIYFVENSKAEDIADVLSKIYGDGKGSTRTAKKDTKSRRDTRTTSRSKRTTKTTSAKDKAAGSAPSLLEGEIKIVTDEPTNAIIVLASPQDWAIIKDTILQLDIIPKQVLIAVLIAEVTLSGDTEFGVEWSLLGGKSSLGGYEGRDKTEIGYGIGGLGEDLTKNLAKGFTYRFNSSRLQAFLVAQASQNKLNILSSPHILAADNKEARIEVGQEVPIVTSEYVPQDIELQTSTSRSIEYRSTGVILTVTPRINEKGLVAMDINQEVSEAQPVVAGGIQSPVISNRVAETSLVVQDGQTIVIGGLIKDQASKTIAGIPIFSHIPLISYLFSDTKSKKEKIELVILITPHVVNNIDEASGLTNELRTKLKNINNLIKQGGDYWKFYNK